VQDDIAQSVVKEMRHALMLEAPSKQDGAQVKAEVAAASKGRSENAQAYQLYLQGRFFREQLTKEGSTKAIQYYLQAIHVDPSYALAWAGLSRAYADQAGQNWVPFDDGFKRAKAAAQRAIELEPELAEGYAALGWVQRVFDWDWKGAEASLERALELAPGNSLVMNAVANIYGSIGQLDAAIDLARKATQLDPLNIPVHRNLVLFCLAAGELEEAEVVLNKLLQMGPQTALVNCWLGLVALAHGRSEEALELMHREVTDIFRLAGLAVAHHSLGNWGEYEAALAELIEKFGKDSPYQIAEVYGACGNPDKAFEWLDRAYTDRDPGLSYLRMDPFLREMREEPRWQPLLQKLGLAD